ncbi:hypothetical protein [Ornithinimicrobium sp. W1665]
MEHDDGLVRSGAQADDGALSLGAVAVLFVFVPVAVISLPCRQPCLP